MILAVPTTVIPTAGSTDDSICDLAHDATEGVAGNLVSSRPTSTLGNPGGATEGHDGDGAPPAVPHPTHLLDQGFQGARAQTDDGPSESSQRVVRP